MRNGLTKAAQLLKVCIAELCQYADKAHIYIQLGH